MEESIDVAAITAEEDLVAVDVTIVAGVLEDLTEAAAKDNTAS